MGSQGNTSKIDRIVLHFWMEVLSGFHHGNDISGYHYNLVDPGACGIDTDRAHQLARRFRSWPEKDTCIRSL